jgi:hypothetical protein
LQICGANYTPNRQHGHQNAQHVDRLTAVTLHIEMASYYGVKPYVSLLIFAGEICPDRSRIQRSGD